MNDWRSFGLSPNVFRRGALLSYRFFIDRAAKGNETVGKPETTEADRVEE